MKLESCPEFEAALAELATAAKSARDDELPNADWEAIVHHLEIVQFLIRQRTGN